MQQTWSAYRITLLLYLGVLALPFSFYYTYNSIQSLTSDTTVIHQISKNGGEMLAFVEISDEGTRKKVLLKIDKELKDLKPWFVVNNKQEFYVGGKTLQGDFDKLLSAWNTLKNNPQRDSALQCWKTSKSLNFIIEKMLLLKQNKIENIFYINMISAIIFLLLLIYMIRVYIGIQLKKQAIHDYETKLFNQKYFLAECKSTCARAVRHEYPLSMLHIEIKGFEKGDTRYDKKTKMFTLKAFGTLISSLVRDGDLPCRYNENHFLILLPFTQKDNALIFENRIREALMKDDCMISGKIEFVFSITEFNKKESEEAFIARSL